MSAPQVDKSKLERLPQFDSVTTEAYRDKTHLYLFDKQDGHLAWQYNILTKLTEYSCDHIRQGMKKVFGL
jgi:hypothetical protein